MTRLVLSMMDRQDLYGAVELRDLDKLNKEFNMNDDLINDINNRIA